MEGQRDDVETHLSKPIREIMPQRGHKSSCNFSEELIRQEHTTKNAK